MEKQSFNDSLDSAHAMNSSQSNSLYNFEPILPVEVTEDLASTETSNPYSNANLLKDIELLIQNMEQKHSKENESMLKNIENLLGNIAQSSSASRPHSPQSMMSNMSADPITSKSPITIRPKPRSPSEPLHNISDDVRSFVSKSIQDISPELVNQIEQELVETFANNTLQSTDSVEDIWKSRDEDDFGARFSMQNFKHNEDNSNNYGSQVNSSFFHTTIEDLQIVDNEFDESVNGQTEIQIEVLDDSPTQIQDLKFIAAIDDVPVNTGISQPQVLVDKITVIEKPVVAQTMKYKSKFSLKTLKGSKSSQKYSNKKRNSLIVLEKMLNKQQKKEEQTSTKKASTKTAVPIQLEPTSTSNLNLVEQTSIVEPVMLIQPISTTDILIAQSPEAEPIIETINQEIEQQESLTNIEPNHIEQSLESQLSESAFVEESVPNSNALHNQTENENVDQEIKSEEHIVDIPIHQNVNDNGQEHPGTSSSLDLDAVKSPQNLSELVEDTQRLIKQMKDEINAIYVSDDDSQNSEDSYSEDWADGDYLDEEYIEEESEYEDWSGSGEYIESEESIHEQEETVIDDESHDANLQNNSLVSDMPNDTESNNSNTSTLANGSEASSDTSNVVHGKLELTPIARSGPEGSQVFIVDSTPSNEDENSLMEQDGLPHAESVEIILPVQHHNQNSNEAISIVITDLSDEKNTQTINNTPNIESPAIQITEIQSAPAGATEIFTSVIEPQVDAHDDTIKRTPSFVTITEIVDDQAILNNVLPPSTLTVVDNNTNNDIVTIESTSETIQPAEEILRVVDNIVIHEPLITPVLEPQETLSTLVNPEESRVDVVSEVTTINLQEEIVAQAPSTVEEQNLSGTISASIEIVPPRIIKKTGTIKRKKSVITPTDIQKAKETLDNVLQAQMSKGIETELPRKNSLGNSNALGAKKKSSDSSTNNNRKGSIDKPKKNSVVGPFGFLSSSNVKNMQKEFLNKAASTEVAGPSKSQPTKLVRPSKLAQPKTAGRVSTFANKLTKLITPTTDSGKLKDAGPAVDHSKSKIPKKKYIETCFSDDYQSSDDDNDPKNDNDMQRPLRIVNKFAQQSEDDEEETREV